MPIDIRGGIRSANLRAHLTMLAKTDFIVWNEEQRTLKNGDRSHIYVNGRNDITDEPSILRLMGDLIARATFKSLSDRERRKVIFMGIYTAGQPLAVAASLSRIGGPKGYRTFRETPKSHGSHHSYVDGDPDPSSHIYALVDNVITDGASKREAVEKLEQSGYFADEIIHVILVDRQQGAVEKLQSEEFNIVTVMNLLDIVWAYGELGLWPKERVKAVEAEIELLQLA